MEDCRILDVRDPCIYIKCVTEKFPVTQKLLFEARTKGEFLLSFFFSLHDTQPKSCSISYGEKNPQSQLSNTYFLGNMPVIILIVLLESNIFCSTFPL